MILGLGNDLADTRRFEKSLQKIGDRLAQRILSDHEFAGFSTAGQPAVFLAKRFAVKEAVAKALGTGFRQGVSWRDISLHHTELGQPEVRLSGAAQRRLELLHGSTVHVSLSDEAHLVCAFAVIC